MSEHQSKLIITPGHASHLAINNSREGQVVEDLSTVSPDGDWAVLAEALVVEAVDLGDLPRLVVSPDQGYPVWVTHLRNTAEARRWGQGYFRNLDVKSRDRALDLSIYSDTQVTTFSCYENLIYGCVVEVKGDPYQCACVSVFIQNFNALFWSFF